MIETPPLKSKATRLGKLFEKHGIKLSRKEQLEYVAHLEGAANWAHLAAEHPEPSLKSQVAARTSAKEAVLATDPSPVLEAFLDTLAELETRDNPRGKRDFGGQGFGWKIGNRVFVVEKELRERLMTRLPETLRRDYENRKSRFHHPATDDLIRELLDLKWSVLELEDALPDMTGRITLKPGFALWTLFIGASWQPHEVFIVDIPERFSHRLPEHDSYYGFSFRIPEFQCLSSQKFVVEPNPDVDRETQPPKRTILKRKEVTAHAITLKRANDERGT